MSLISRIFIDISFPENEKKFKIKRSSIIYLYHTFFTYLSIERELRLASFQVTMNNAVINMNVRLFVQHELYSYVCIHKSDILGLYNRSSFNVFVKTLCRLQWYLQQLIFHQLKKISLLPASLTVFTSRIFFLDIRHSVLINTEFYSYFNFHFPD